MDRFNAGKTLTNKRFVNHCSENETVWRRWVVVGDHDPEPTDDVVICCSPADYLRMQMARRD